MCMNNMCVCGFFFAKEAAETAGDLGGDRA